MKHKPWNRKAKAANTTWKDLTMSRTRATSFDYTMLNESSAAQLKQILTTIRRNTHSSTRAILSTGMALLEAKRHLQHGQFKEWVCSQCGFCMRTAERYMRAAELLEDKYDTVSHLQPSTLYRLSAKSMPHLILQSVLLRLTEDGPLSNIAINELIDQLLDTEQVAVEPDRPTNGSALIAAWLEAPANERNALLDSDRTAFATGAWLLMPPEEQAAFVNTHHDALAYLLAQSKRNADTPTDDPVRENVVPLFGELEATPALSSLMRA